jgi:hypothetical protein
VAQVLHSRTDPDLYCCDSPTPLGTDHAPATNGMDARRNRLVVFAIVSFTS